MIVFLPPISLSNQLHLGIVTILFSCQGEITEKFFKIIFSLLIPIRIMRTQKKRDSHVHIPFNFLFITISMYRSTTKVKAHGENLVHKDQKLLMNLNGSNWAQLMFETGSETLIFCCRNSTDTKQKLVEVKSAVQMLWTIFSGFRSQSRI